MRLGADEGRNGMPAKPSFSKTSYPLCTFSSAPSTHFAVSVSVVPPPRYEYGANSAETPNSSTKYSAAIECWEHHRQFRSRKLAGHYFPRYPRLTKA
ncbi:hypothetical protein B0T12DRAFT_12097 [Alternaria alternata]|nr:hypothetical protein B0T12DRAFT_12097 [Alternaria alternata]